MIKIITIDDLKKIINKIGIQQFIMDLVNCLQQDFSNWHRFQKSIRHAIYIEEGVIELMPIYDELYYAVKYVNGHPNNPYQNKLTVVALGLLVDIASGYPLLLSEMTVLTALRTAATSALAAKYLVKKNPATLAIIGTGAQSEFQVLAHHFITGIKQINYYDIDQRSMRKFSENLKQFPLKLTPYENVQSTLADADIIITATAARKTAHVLENEWIKPGMHINCIGGDAPGKTELDPQILNRSKVVVECIEQTQIEGEIQNINPAKVYAELWELTSGRKPGRENNNEITVFDSVGFALEDYSALKYLYQLIQQHNFGQLINLIPVLEDPKNLFGHLISPVQ